MTVRRRLPAAVGLTALLLALATLAGCNPGGYATYEGQPRGISARGFQIQYPSRWRLREMPQSSHFRMLMCLIYDNTPPPALKPGDTPPTLGAIRIHCFKLRTGETDAAFMDRYYDELEPRYLKTQMRLVGKRGGPVIEYRGTVDPYADAKRPQMFVVFRALVLPRERLAYVVESMCSPDYVTTSRPRLTHAVDSFRLLPANRGARAPR